MQSLLGSHRGSCSCYLKPGRDLGSADEHQAGLYTWQSHSHWEKDQCGGWANLCFSQGFTGLVCGAHQLLVCSWVWLLFLSPCTPPMDWPLLRTCPGLSVS